MRVGPLRFTAARRTPTTRPMVSAPMRRSIWLTALSWTTRSNVPSIPDASTIRQERRRARRSASILRHILCGSKMDPSSSRWPDMLREGGIVILGAGECGARAAFALREQGYQGAMTLIGSERHLPYERPPLSKSTLVDEPGHRFVAPIDRYEEARIELLL